MLQAPGAFARPFVEILFGHSALVCNETGEVLCIGNAGVEEIECQLKVLLDPLLDGFQVCNRHAVDGIRRPSMADESLPVRFFPELFQLGHDLLASRNGGGRHSLGGYPSGLSRSILRRWSPFCFC